MPRSNIIVGGVDGLLPTDLSHSEQRPLPRPQSVAIQFNGGQSAFLDMSSSQSAVWASVLTSLSQADLPAYVEVDPATNVVTQLLVPLRVRVGNLTPSPDDDAVDVELIVSHGRHTLRRTNPDFDQFLELLQTARDQGTTVFVTETPDTHEIIDVRQAPAPLALPEFEATTPPNLDLVPTPVTLQRAYELFNMVNSQLCCPGDAPAPCIPFQYPDDGCWGRAHEMCRLIIATGVQPEKVWIYGSLRVASANHPLCEVRWGWHVAVTLRVGTSAAWQLYVIDPSLLTAPAPQATWVGLQGDPAAAVEASDAAIFYRPKGGGGASYDPTYQQTQQVLTTYRNFLKLRTASPSGPPPYPQCLTRPAGVQWYGSIAAGATARWFTYGWPSSWHVIWTIMPLTLCPGGPQLSWSVQVERANATQCTYWISVKNQSSSPVRFEGRYDILSR
jgi:hypothetical protein